MTEPVIEFLCHPEDKGVIPEPYPARKLMPDWFKSLQPKIDGKNLLENSTIKRCAPFLDAMTAGWIIPLAADVQFMTNDDGSGVNYKWSFYRTMVENHAPQQIAGHPHLPRPPMKFMNYWGIRVPSGYSVMFMPPMNRIDPRFQCISGIVDCDLYEEFINFPFFFTQDNFTGILKQGTPLVQVIPFRRDAAITEHNCRKLENADLESLELIRRKRKAHESVYRDELWVRK